MKHSFELIKTQLQGAHERTLINEDDLIGPVRAVRYLNYGMELIEEIERLRRQLTTAMQMKGKKE